MNKVFLVGRLARDPELRYTTSNMATMNCSLAVSRDFVRQGEEPATDFIRIVAFGQRAEAMKKYLSKGSQIAVDGRIQTGSYEKDGQTHYTTDIIVDNFQFLDKKGTVNNDSTDNDFQAESNNNSDVFADFGANIEVGDSDLPF